MFGFLDAARDFGAALATVAGFVTIACRHENLLVIATAYAKDCGCGMNHRRKTQTYDMDGASAKSANRDIGV